MNVLDRVAARAARFAILRFLKQAYSPRCIAPDWEGAFYAIAFLFFSVLLNANMAAAAWLCAIIALLLFADRTSFPAPFPLLIVEKALRLQILPSPRRVLPSESLHTVSGSLPTLFFVQMCGFFLFFPTIKNQQHLPNN